jgi:hypothetical protein
MTSPRLTLALLIWLTCIVGFSLVIPQAPYRLEDPLQRSQWLSGVPREMWPVMESLQPWGLFQLFSSVWLRLPMALLLAHALVRLAASALPAYQRTRRLDVSAAPEHGTGFRLGRSVAVTSAPTTFGPLASRRLTEQLVHAGYEVRLSEDGGGWVARRQPYGWPAHAGVYAGLALLAAGLLLQGWLGQVIEINLQPGQAMRLPADGRTTLVLEDVAWPVEHRLSDNGGLVTLRVISEAGSEDTFDLSLHHSRLVQGAWLTAADALPVVDIRAMEISSGRDVLLQPLVGPGSPRVRVRLPLSANPDERFAGVPAQNVTLRVDYATEEPATGRIVVRFFRGIETAPGLVTEVDDGGVTEFDGVRYHLVLDQDIRLRAQVGLWWLVTACGWLVVVVSATILAVARSVWVTGWTVNGTHRSRLAVSADVLADEHAAQGAVAGLTDWLREEAHE